MASNIHDERPMLGVTQEIFFAGDDVRLAGQIDYPDGKTPHTGYPLIFIIQHATCTSRKNQAHYAQLGMSAGAAVFRWDKRGTGSSGSSGQGSAANDVLYAYEKALSLPSINPNRAVIIAQNEGTLAVGEMYQQFAEIKRPLGVVLAGNMLDEKAIIAIDVPVHCVVSKNDWNAWQTYAEDAAEAHAAKYNYTASYYVATNTDRRLMYTSGATFHRGAASSITHWLEHTCQIS